MPQTAERERLAAAIRELVRATRVTEVDDATLASARALVDEATKLLAAETYDGPHCQTGFGAMAEQVDFAGPPAGWFPFSPVVGPCNPLSPPVTFEVVDEEVDGTVAKVVVGTATLTEPYNGPPWDATHGGVVAEVFDELLGVTTIAAGVPGYTGRLTVHYRKPTPIGQGLHLRGWIEHVSGRKVVAKGEIRADGAVTAEAEGLFIQTGGTLTAEG